MAVATEAGAVNLRSGDQVVEVREGQQSVAVEGQPPSAPSAISTELLLKVAAAAAGKRCAMEGRTAPSAQIWVDGAPAKVGADGRFEVATARGSGSEVRLRDVSGREVHKRVSCGPPSHAIKRMSIEW